MSEVSRKSWYPDFDPFLRHFVRRCRLPNMCFLPPFLSTPSVFPWFLCVKNLYIDTDGTWIHGNNGKAKEWTEKGAKSTYLGNEIVKHGWAHLFLPNWPQRPQQPCPRKYGFSWFFGIYQRRGALMVPKGGVRDRENEKNTACPLFGIVEMSNRNCNSIW